MWVSGGQRAPASLVAHRSFDSEYDLKWDLLRSQVNLILHEALRSLPATTISTPTDAASRLTKQFLGQLDAQFPLDSTDEPIRLRKAADFACRLAVHVNHLNAVVQRTTGQSTTAHINTRLLAEARALLLHTDWPVATIALTLGFDYPAYFTTFFRKHTGQSPMSFRKIR